MAIDSHIFTPDNIDSWSYQEFEDWLASQDDELQTAFADIANTPTEFEAFDPINELPPTYQDLLAVLDYAGIPQELLVSDATLTKQTLNSARRFGSVSTYTSPTTAETEMTSELFLSDEELLSFDPVNETLTDAELLPILSDEETFARWIELHGISDLFIDDEGFLFVPMNAGEFNDVLLEADILTDADRAIETTSKPSLEPQQRVTEFREQMLDLYSQTKIFYDTQLIVDISGALDLKQSPSDRLPKVVLDLFVHYVELRAGHGEQAAKDGIRNDLKQLIGYSDTDLDSSTIQNAIARAFDGLVRVTPELLDYVNSDTSVEDTYTTVLNAIRGNPTALQHFNAVTHATDIESRLLKQSKSLAASMEELKSLDSISDIASFIHPFLQDAQAQAHIYQMLGVNEELVATAGKQRIVPGTENRTIKGGDGYENKPLFERVPRPSGIDVNTWNTACQLADANKHIESTQTLRTIASIGGALIVGIVAGAINPALGIAAGTAVAAATGAYDVYTESAQLSTIRAGESVTRGSNKDTYLASPEGVDLAETEVEYAMISAAVGVALGAVGGVAGSKISTCSFKTATSYLMRAGLTDDVATGVARFAANSSYGALDSLTAAITDGRVASKSYLVEREILAGGDGTQASAVKAVAFQVGIGTLFGMGADVGMEGVLRLFQKSASGKILYRTADGLTIDVTNSNIVIVRDIETGQTKVVLEGHEDLPDGLDITEAFQNSVKDIDTATLKNIDLPDGVDEDSITLAYKRAQQTGRELSVFRTPDGKVVIRDGGKDTTDSVLKDIPGLGHISGAVFSAHFHPSAPYPSRADLEIFHARAMQSPGILQEHIIYGFDADGQPASLTLQFRYNTATGRVDSSVNGSESLNSTAVSYFERMAHQIDEDVASGHLDVSESAVHQRAEQKAANNGTFITAVTILQLLDGMPELKSQLDADDYAYIRDAVETNDTSLCEDAVSTMAEKNPQIYAVLEQKALEIEFNETITTAYLTQEKSIPRNFEITATILTKYKLLKYTDECIQLIDFIGKNLDWPSDYTDNFIKQASTIITSLANASSTQRSESIALFTQFEKQCYGVLKGSRDRYVLQQKAVAILSQDASKISKGTDLKTIMSLASPTLLADAQQTLFGKVLRMIPPIAARSDAQNQFEQILTGEKNQYRKDVLFDILRNPESQSALLALLRNSNITPNDLNSFIDMANFSLIRNNYSPPDYLTKIMTSLSNSENPSGFMIELFLHNEMSFLMGRTTTTKNLSINDLPPGLRNRSGGSDVRVSFTHKGMSHSENLDMDLVLTAEGITPIQYAEIKSSLNNPTDRQSKQLEKMKAAYTQGLTGKPGCFTTAVSPQRAQELIQGGYYSFIVQVDPRTNRMTVYPNSPVTLPSNHTLRNGDVFRYASSRVQNPTEPRSLGEYWN